MTPNSTPSSGILSTTPNPSATTYPFLCLELLLLYSDTHTRRHHSSTGLTAAATAAATAATCIAATAAAAVNRRPWCVTFEEGQYLQQKSNPSHIKGVTWLSHHT